MGCVRPFSPLCIVSMVMSLASLTSFLVASSMDLFDHVELHLYLLVLMLPPNPVRAHFFSGFLR
jgi:hypothetical protein